MEDTRPWKIVKHDISRPEYAADRIKLAESIRSFICDEKCPDCPLTQHTDKKQNDPQFSYRSRLTPEEAEKVCADRVSKIKEHREHLCDILSRCADDVISRWSKKGRYGSQQKREDLLKSVAPDMAQSENFLVEWYYSTDRLQVLSRKASDRFKLMHSWLSVDLLKSNPDALFALLHNRTAFSPDRWVQQDVQYLYPHFHQGDVDVDWADRLVVTHDEDKFGTLIELNSKDLHQKYAMAFPMGCLVLDAQATLLETLRKIVDKILEGLDTTKPGRIEKWLAMTSPPDFKALGGVEGWSWFTYGALCAPIELDLKELLTTVKVRRERSEDYLLAVQGESRNFLDAIEAAIAKHDMEKKNSEDAVGKLLCIQMEIASHRYISYRILETELIRIAAIKRPVGPFGNIIEFQEPPGYADFDQAIQGFKHLLYETLAQKIADLQILFALSPALKGCWTLDQQKLQQGRLLGICTERKGVSLEDLRTKFIDWFACMVAKHPNEWEDIGHRNLLSLFETFLNNEAVPKEEKARIDDHEYRAICEIVILFEILQRVIHNHYPLVLRPMMRMPDANYGIRGPRRIAMLRQMLYIFDGLCTNENPQEGRGRQEQKQQKPQYTGHALGTLCVQSFQQFSDFLHRFKPTPAEDERLLLARQALIENRMYFWQMIAHHVHDEYARALVSDNEKSKFFDMVHPFHCVELAMNAVQELDKQKKTRDQKFLEFRQASNNGSGDAVGETGGNKPRRLLQPLAVSQQHYNEVFAAMFPITESERHRATNWRVFVQAMRSVGFRVAVCAGGLEVEFRSKRFGNMVIYKPHVSWKVGAADLQDWGRRFAHRCRWNRERFVIEGQEVECKTAEAKAHEAMGDAAKEFQLMMDEAMMNDVD